MPALILSTNPTNAFSVPRRLTFDNQGSPPFADGALASNQSGPDVNRLGQSVMTFTTSDQRIHGFGIASISVAQAETGQASPGVDVNEAFSAGPPPLYRGDGRGLFFDGTRLFLDTYQPGVTTGRQTFLRPEFTIQLIGNHRQFGFSFADRSNTTMGVEVFLQGILVDSLTFQYTETALPDKPEYFVVSVASSAQYFDQVKIYQPATQSDNGWGFDDLTVEGRFRRGSLPPPPTLRPLPHGDRGGSAEPVPLFLEARAPTPALAPADVAALNGFFGSAGFHPGLDPVPAFSLAAPGQDAATPPSPEQEPELFTIPPRLGLGGRRLDRTGLENLFTNLIQE